MQSLLFVKIDWFLFYVSKNFDTIRNSTMLHWIWGWENTILPQAKFHCKFHAHLSYPFHASHSEISKLTKTWYIKPQILEAKIVITGILTELLFPLWHLYKNTVYFAAILLVLMGRATLNGWSWLSQPPHDTIHMYKSK